MNCTPFCIWFFHKIWPLFINDIVCWISSNGSLIVCSWSGVGGGEEYGDPPFCRWLLRHYHNTVKTIECNFLAIHFLISFKSLVTLCLLIFVNHFGKFVETLPNIDCIFQPICLPSSNFFFHEQYEMLIKHLSALNFTQKCISSNRSFSPV